MQICLAGAGAVGSCIAGRMAAAGARVTLLARGARAQSLRDQGLVLEAPDGRLHHHLGVSDDPRAVPPPDLVVVATKTTAYPDIARMLPRLLHPGSAILFVSNGLPWWYGAAGLPSLLDPGGALGAATAGHPVASGLIWASCTLQPDGTVRVSGSPGRMVIGHPGTTAAPAFADLAELASAGGLPTAWRGDILTLVWHKLTSNLVSAALAGPDRLTMAEALRRQGAEDLARQLAAEIAALAHAAGHSPGFDIDDFLARTRGLDHRPSLVQDLLAGAPAELTSQILAPLHLAARLGQPVPALTRALAPVLAAQSR